MMKRFFIGLTASILALSGLVAIAPAFSNRGKEVSATDTHIHEDTTEFVTPLDNNFFKSTADHGWVSDVYTMPAGSYYLSENINLDYDFTLKIESEVKLCLNGKSFNGLVGANKTIFHIDGEGASLTIDDCDDHIHHFFLEPEDPNAYKYYYGKITDSEHGNIFYGGYITNLTNPIVTVDNGGTFKLKGGNFIGGRKYGQFNINDNSSAVFEGGYIGGSLNEEGYAAINLEDQARAEFKGGFECYDCQGKSSGAAISATEETQLIIGESTFSSNSADYYGGAIHTNGHIEINGTTFIGNHSELGGGAICLGRIEDSLGGEVKINNATFESNSGGFLSGQCGGAIHFEIAKEISDPNDKSSTLTVTNSSFTQNKAPLEGGAISFEDKSCSFSYFNVENCSFNNNTSNENNDSSGDNGLGGAIFYKACTFSENGTYGHLNIKGSSFDENHANEGGSIAIVSRPHAKLDAVIEDTEIKDNSADRSGGAISATSYGEIGDLTLTIKGTSNITGNYAFNKASGVCANKVVVKLGGSVYLKNNGWSDLYIPSGQETSVDILEGGLIGNALIGIDMEEPGDFTKTLANGIAKNNISHFTSNVTNYFVNINKTNDQLMLSTERPTPPTPPGPTPDPTPDPTSEDKPVYEKDGVEIDVPSDFVMPTDVTIRVEVRADVKEASSEVDYNKIKEKLNSNEYISKVYDVKLIKTEGGIETEIQPSDLKEGMKLKVKISLTKDVSLKGLRILHIHSVDDMEFVNAFSVKGKTVTFNVTRLSQFAFINPIKSGSILGWLIPVIILGVLILACFILALLRLRFLVYVEDKDPRIVRGFKLWRAKEENEFFIVRTIKDGKVHRLPEELFWSKKKAQDYMKALTKK